MRVAILVWDESICCHLLRMFGYLVMSHSYITYDDPVFGLSQALSGAHRAAGVWHGPDPQERMLSYRQRDTARKRMFAVNSLWTKNGMPAEVVELMQIYGSHVSLLYISFCLLLFFLFRYIAPVSFE